MYGLILAGGKSSRMGFDKATIRYHGVNQIEWLHDQLKNLCDKIFVSGSPLQIKGDYNFIEDQFDRGGPLNGILSANKTYPEQDWLIVPIDMPNLKIEALQFLFNAHKDAMYATCFLNLNSQLEPLPVILHKRSFPLLIKRFMNQDESLNRFLTESKCNAIPPQDNQWLKNVNDPSHL